jgi:hypothetical protein
MSSEKYNCSQIKAGKFTKRHIAELVRTYQRDCGLTVDGMFGPRTRHSMDTRHLQSELGLETLEIAVAELGNGEVGGNNSGPHVARYKGIEDDGDPDNDGAWCASFISWCISEAAEELNVKLPLKTSHGAKRLYKNAVSGGGLVVARPQAGDLVCWDRGRPGSWQGHIGIVERVEGDVMYTVEGNVGRYPSVVRRMMYDLSRQDRLVGFVRITDVEGGD